jgi:4-amino-4-deoxy-L-arabinose transferase-like glycosyltransferase
MIAALVVALATGVRLAWVLLVPSKPVGDFAMYLESAAYLVAHGQLDPEFVYMPGYVLLVAAVNALGGGLLAAKLLGVAFGGIGAGAVYGIAHHLWDRRAALGASLLYALWPAGIAVASVTGTDLPAGVLIAVAGWALVRWGPGRPVLAAVLFGVAMGAAGWIRAVALPLAALAAFYWRAQGSSWRQVLERTAIGCVAAALLLAPWAVRNRLRYGELFITDSHGGLTALVGANPNTEGRYSRSLNRMFHDTTGFTLLAEPHRAADRAAYAMARDWTAFEPAYAAGLAIKKAERLLDNQRPLLYWPLYRPGVLAQPNAWDGRRGALEALVDVFWVALVTASLLGLGVALARRRYVALSFVPLQLALIGIYALFFAETRYVLPIALLLFPPAGAGLVWLGESAVRLARERPLSKGLGREALIAGGLAALVLAGWPMLRWTGAWLRAGHRWAAAVCHAGGEARICKWRGRSPVGVWNGVGLAVNGVAEAAIPLAAGKYRVKAALDLAPIAAGDGAVLVRAGTFAVTMPLDAIAEATRAGRRVQLDGETSHGGGPLVVRFEVRGRGGSRIWLSDLTLGP